MPALALIVSVLAACGAVTDGSPASPRGGAAQPTSSPGDSEPGGSEVVSIDLGAEAWSAKAGFGGIWVQVDPPVDEMLKVDVSTSQIVLRIARGRNVAMADDAVWVALGEEVVKIDPVSGETQLTAPVGGSYLAYGAGSVWVAGPEGALVRVDPTTGTPVASIPVAPAGVTEVAATDDAVWVTSKSAGAVYRIDPSSNAVVASITTGRGAHGVVIDRSGVWVTNYEEPTVSRIDPVTNTVVATVEDVGSGVGIVAADGAIWVSTRWRGISRIDPATNVATLVAELPEWNYGIAYDEGALWVTDVDGKSLSRVAVALP